MAKAKKMTDAEVTDVVVTEVKDVKDVDFKDLEFKIEKPVLNKDKTVTITGNWESLKGNIKAVVDRYKGTKLTEDNVDYVKTLKAQFVSLRTGIDRERKEYKKAYLDPAENLLKAMCDELLKVIDEGESALGAQLDEYDQRRKDELTVILNEYVDEASEKYQLRDEYKKQIQLKKQYYNKTQKEEDSIDDINAQAEELAKKQKEYDTGVALIKAECEDAELLPDAYIRELAYRNAMEIIMEIIKATTTDRKTLYQLTRGADVRKVSEIVGQDLIVKNFVLYKDQKSNGDFMQVLAIEAEDGTMVATNSSTFINEFTGIAEICGPEPADMIGEKVRVMAGTGKSGRRFMTCVWA